MSGGAGSATRITRPDVSQTRSLRSNRGAGNLNDRPDLVPIQALRSANPLGRISWQTEHLEIGVSLFRLGKRSREFRLPNDACQRAASELSVDRHGDRHGSCLQLLLHGPRIRHTSRPERTRSLPNQHLDLGYKDVVVSPLRDFRWRCRLEKQRQCFDQVRPGFFD